MHCEERIIGNGPRWLLVQPTARHETPSLAQETAALSAGIADSFVLCLIHLDDWTLDLMPWADRNISRETEAGQRACKTLRFITEEVLPRYPGLPAIIGGYSLGGLFALWASMQTDRFAAIAAASPSLWIADWIPYAELNPTQAKNVYLSLGNREEKVRNKAIARVGDCVRTQYGMLERQLGRDHCILVREEGNHFTDNAGRLARAFCWCVRTVKGGTPPAYIWHYDSPLGGMTMESDGDSLTGLRFDRQKHSPSSAAQCLEKRLPIFDETCRWLDVYFSGQEPDFTPALCTHGTPFRQAVWEVLLTIPYGKTLSYGEIASQLARRRGIPRISAQAVGGAVGHNPIALIIPCHRVIGADGSLTGYAAGLDKKARLLQWESRFHVPGIPYIRTRKTQSAYRGV